MAAHAVKDRKSTRLNSSHTEIYTLSLHDALPILADGIVRRPSQLVIAQEIGEPVHHQNTPDHGRPRSKRSEEHTSELQSHRDLHSFPTRRSSDLGGRDRPPSVATGNCPGNR